MIIFEDSDNEKNMVINDGDLLCGLIDELLKSYLIISDRYSLEDLFDAMAWHSSGGLLHAEFLEVPNQGSDLFRAVDCVEADHSSYGVKLHSISHRRHICNEDMCDNVDKLNDGDYSYFPCPKCMYPYDVVVTWMMVVCDFGGVIQSHYLNAGVIYGYYDEKDDVECWESGDRFDYEGPLFSVMLNAHDEIEIRNRMYGN